MPSIKVTSPISTDIVRRGEYITIKWEIIDTGGFTYNVVDIVAVKYDSSGYELIALGVDRDQGFYIWKVPDNIDIYDYFINISESPSGVTDNGDTFSLLERFSITEFSKLNDLEKIILVEMKLGKVLVNPIWVAGSGGSFYTLYDSQEEFVSFKSNDNFLIRVFSEADCGITDGSFFHDYRLQRLYINPNELDPFYVGYVFKCFTNRQDSNFLITFKPQNALLEVFYLPYLETNSIPSINQKVADYYTSAMITQFGTLTFVNDGWWWSKEYTYEWHNKEITVKLGEKTLEYNKFVTIFTGITKNPSLSDELVTIGVKDARAGYLKSIPVVIMETSALPELSSGDENKPYPALFGIKNNITLIRVDDKEYMIGGVLTEPDSTQISYESVDAVYVDGIAQVLTYDYTVNVSNNKITFVNDPNNGLVTADVHGLQCEVDFLDGSFTGNFSENTADILYTILVSPLLNNIPIDRIDIDSFLLFQTKRTQRLGFFLDKLKPTMDIVRTLQSSAIFHFIPTLDGRFQVRYYDRVVSDIPSFYNEDYKGFKINKITDSAFEKVIIKYDRDPSTDEWLQVEGKVDETKYKHDKSDVLTIETYLVNQTEAESLVTFYLGLVKDPSARLVTELPAVGLELLPSDKRRFNRDIVAGDGTDIQIREDEIYLILEVQKNINTAKVNIVAIKDLQSTGGYSDHTDGTHTDEHTDGIHSDISHSDAHSDAHTDSHTDAAHTDTHDDIAHTDEAHEDISHTDTYDDIVHTDTHDDIAHSDEHEDDYDDYTDDPHLDDHTDEHLDTPHSDDHDDVSHIDIHDDIIHTDEAHEDIEHTDIHGDGHADDYDDEHSDTHDDIPHTDSDL